RPHDRALLQLHAERTEGAIVLRRIGIDEIRERDDHRRLRVRKRRVDESRDLRVALGQIDFEIAAALGHAGADVDILELVAVVVEKSLAYIHAVLPFGYDRAHLPLGTVEHSLDGGARRLGAELADEL